MSSKYAKKQWLILLVYSVLNILTSSSVSLQQPFYPMISEQKGVTPSQYGFVFGAFYLSALFANPVVGVMISKFGAVIISISGLFIIGITSISFSFVDKLNGASLFLSISIVIRILEAVGYIMVRVAGTAIVSFEFSDHVEMAFAFIQSFASTGGIMGPVIGGALYEFGGFFLPFTVVGALLLCSAFVIMFLPKDYPKKGANSVRGREILKLLQTSTVVLGIFSTIGSCVSISFIITVLEPHVRSFYLSPVEVGSMFLCSALVFGLSSLFWSKVYDKYDNAQLICSISTLFIICGMALLGPAPYLPFDKTIYSCLFGIVIHAVGSGGEQIAGLSCLHKGAKLAGLPQSIQTYGLISALFTSLQSVGCFIGSLLGGYLYETFEFGWGSHFFIFYNVLLFIGSVLFICLKGYNLKHDENLNSILSSEKDSVKYKSIETN